MKNATHNNEAGEDIAKVEEALRKLVFFSQSDLKERGIKTKCQLCRNCTCGKNKEFSGIVYESGRLPTLDREPIRAMDKQREYQNIDINRLILNKDVSNNK